MDFVQLTKYVAYCKPDILSSLPESEEDFHDAVEVADVPGLLCSAQDAAEDCAAGGGVARLRDHQVHDPLTHLLIRREKPVLLCEEKRKSDNQAS